MSNIAYIRAIDPQTGKATGPRYIRRSTADIGMAMEVARRSGSARHFDDALLLDLRDWVGRAGNPDMGDPVVASIYAEIEERNIA